MKSFCIKCKVETNQKVLLEEHEHIVESGGWYDDNYYQIIKCEGCDTISFRKLHSDVGMEHSWSSAEMEGTHPYDIDLYPSRSANHLPINIYSKTPRNIRSIYKETIEAYNNNQLILCGGGLRAIIEGICIDKGVLGIERTRKDGKIIMVKDLQAKIEGMAKSGNLTVRSAEILHNLRFIGNEALHELSAPPRSELNVAIKIVEHTIESLYEIEFKAKKLKDDIEQRKLKPTPEK